MSEPWKRRKRSKKEVLSPQYCEIPDCKYDKIVQRHRIVPGREGGIYELGNVISLCPTHHAEADRDWMSREELLGYIRERVEKTYVELAETQYKQRDPAPEE